MFRYSASALSCSAPRFRGVPELFRRSAGVPWCFVVPELFRRTACVPSCSSYSAGVLRSVVPCSGVPAFIVCRHQHMELDVSWLVSPIKNL